MEMPSKDLEDVIAQSAPFDHNCTDCGCTISRNKSVFDLETRTATGHRLYEWLCPKCFHHRLEIKLKKEQLIQVKKLNQPKPVPVCECKSKLIILQQQITELQQAVCTLQADKTRVEIPSPQQPLLPPSYNSSVDSMVESKWNVIVTV